MKILPVYFGAESFTLVRLTNCWSKLFEQMDIFLFKFGIFQNWDVQIAIRPRQAEDK